MARVAIQHVKYQRHGRARPRWAPMGGAPLMTLLLAWMTSSILHADPGHWVLVDVETRTLSVMQGSDPKLVFEGISHGRGGVAEVRYRGDHKTPLGEFRVRWVNPESMYHLFFGLDYPRLDAAERAYHEGRIGWGAYFDIRHAWHENRLPPMDTPLGGFIGIHGIGRGDPDIHRAFDWTQGCIALTNEQMDELAPWIRIGTRVVIR
jgi:murein L,D-transpeptidase YafK